MRMHCAQNISACGGYNNIMEKTAYLITNKQESHRRYWKNVWNYRELYFFFAWRDITVRYKQTLLGIAWVLIRPLLVMGIFTVIFSMVAKLTSNNVPYPLLILAGMLPWQLFANSFNDASNSIINSHSIISKIYFPRIIIPTSIIIVNFVDFLVSALLLVALMCWYAQPPILQHIFILPFFVMLLIILNIGTGLWVSALVVKYRDLRLVAPFIIQCGLYISPIGFSSTIIPTQWQWLYSLNPLVGIVEGFRWTIIDNYPTPTMYSMTTSVVVSLLLLLSGIWYFRKNEVSFADTI